LTAAQVEIPVFQVQGFVFQSQLADSKMPAPTTRTSGFFISCMSPKPDCAYLLVLENQFKGISLAVTPLSSQALFSKGNMSEFLKAENCDEY
jgi:hypothetical protein